MAPSTSIRSRLPELGVVVGSAALLVGGIIGLVRDRTPATAAPEGPAAVAIVDFRFQPGDLTVGAGETVTWTNQDEFAHTVTGQDEADAIDSGDMAEGAAFEFTFTDAGAYEYVCAIHPGMRGTITVEAAG